jgi:hypothetical protein
MTFFIWMEAKIERTGVISKRDGKLTTFKKNKILQEKKNEK